MIHLLCKPPPRVVVFSARAISMRKRFESVEITFGFETASLLRMHNEQQHFKSDLTGKPEV
jgi:hypothetical protein